jgi:hypothetical protein
MGFFFFLSVFGIIWSQSYYAVISDNHWFVLYALFIGWWVSMFPAREYYKKNEDYFNKYL